MHGGLNIIAQTGEIVPLFESCSGMDVFLLQNTSGKIIGEHEIGWRILAQNLGVALEYIAAAKPNRTPPYIGMPKSDEE
jgi:hypothetical protein